KDPSVSNLDHIEDTEQLKRYRSTFPNVILTNFYEFRLYRDGQRIAQVMIGRAVIAQKLKTPPPVENIDQFKEFFDLFFSFSLPKVQTARSLAIELAKRTRFLRDEVIAVEIQEDHSKGHKQIIGFYEAFKQYLIGTLSENQFADLYAQTITYGLFAARTRVPADRNDFNRRLAFDYIPHTIGILRDVFRFISLEEPPKSLQIIVEDIAEILNVTDVNKILHEYHKTGKGKDPIIHFYETFLTTYDPEVRERRGVYYTPEPVVGYIVRAIHSILKSHFGLADGLASEEVKLLDPAAGTLTFPAEAIRLAVQEHKEKYGEGDLHQWIKKTILQNYYAFELMMAPYAIGHLKMGFIFEELGYKMADDERFKLYLTNTLEMEEIKQIAIPGLSSLSEESHLAGKVKKEQPVLVILGNPPYSGISANINDWTERLLKEDIDGTQSYYKVDDHPLGEKKVWLQDDYVKFLRFAQWKIQTSGYGIVGMITNHSYLDNPTFRGMRQSLMKTFDEIYILDLHGNSLKKETTPDLPAPQPDTFWTYVLCCEDESFYIGQTDNIRRRFAEHTHGEVSWTKSRLPVEIILLEQFDSREKALKREKNLKTGFGRKWLKREYKAERLRARQAGGGKDENVFDIRQGVAIVLFIKNKKGKEPKVFQLDKYGLRDEKYDWLAQADFNKNNYREIMPASPWYFFIPRNTSHIQQYLKWQRIDEIFPINVTGIVTARDRFVIGFDKRDIQNRIMQFRNLSVSDKIIMDAYSLKDTRGWKMSIARKNLASDANWDLYFKTILYRPFDNRTIYYTDKMVDWGRPEVMRHMLEDNIALIMPKRVETKIPWRHCLCGEGIIEHVAVSLKTIDYVFPLFIYPEGTKKTNPGTGSTIMMVFEPGRTYGKKPNISSMIFTKLEATFGKRPSPEEIFYYIYAVFYSNIYRETYAEFLKIDFPRVPFTADYKLFKAIGKLGNTLADLHLLKSSLLDAPVARYQGSGDNSRVEKITYNEDEQRIYINQDKYFEGITPEVWNYHIGGYQVLQKYLKDRKGRIMDDVPRYCRIVTALSQTIRIQKLIDKFYPDIEKELIDF
ncbi:MAG: type ISP restriction/modification enzyme, partial [Candidatus Marinimicrobia bacterium]|nr:type ISP restriction/modification enzyme [Candidatus Neomarinimicrobiota bacterium]